MSFDSVSGNIRLADLRHKYRGDSEISEIMECLAETRSRLSVFETEGPDSMVSRKQLESSERAVEMLNHRLREAQRMLESVRSLRKILAAVGATLDSAA